jgi:hypothetical protein
MSPRLHCALLALVALIATSTMAQVFRVQGGTSTLLNAEGGSLEFTAPNYDGSLGLGYYNGQLQFGAETRYKYHKYTILAGDDAVPFLLPTDIFDSSHYFSARGAGISRTEKDRAMYAFAGTTSTSLGTGFFHSATSDDPVAIFFYERKLSDTLRFFSRNLASRRQTFLEGLEYSPQKWMKASVTGGIGSNQKYFAAGIDTETKTLAFKSSYVVTGDMFRRVTITSPMSSEVNKGNVEMLYKPDEHVSVTTVHENLLEPLTAGGPMHAASVDQITTDLNAYHFNFGTGLFRSNTAGRNTNGVNFYAGHRIGRHVEANGNYFESKSQVVKTSIVSGTVRESFSSRFSLLQLVSRTAGQTTYAFGGDYISNRILLRADYQNVYLPFRPDHPFEQALALNASLRITGPWQITAASDVAPDGHLRYAIGVSTYLYRFGGMMMSANSPASFSIPKYLIQGLVKDDQGMPVEGAALHIAKQVAYSDSTGHFQVRFSKHGPFPLSVALNEFITTGIYEVVSAPSEVRAESEDTATDTQIVIRRVPPQRATALQ